MINAPKLPTGNSGLVEWCKQISKLLVARTPIESKDIRWEQGPDGMRPLLKLVTRGGVGGSGTANVQQLKVMSVHGDFLTCRAISLVSGGSGTTDDAIVGATDVIVAKPWRLRQSPFHNKTFAGIIYSYGSGYERSASRAGVVENQVIVPPYHVEDEDTGAEDFDIIWAIDVSGSTTTGYIRVNDTPVPIQWLDMNTDGRAWAERNTFLP